MTETSVPLAGSEADDAAPEHVSMFPAKVGPAHVMPDQVAEKIQAGLPIVFDMIFEHPLHGPLRFTGKLPNAREQLQHRVVTDNLLAGLEAGASFGTQVLSAAMAGLQCGMLTPPVLREERTEEASEERGSVKIGLVKVVYDADEETYIEFLIELWTVFSAWRGSLANPAVVSSLGKSSGATPGSA